MKTFIKNQKIMLVLLLLGAILNANSQPHLCDDPYPPGPIIWKTITLCNATHPGPPPEIGPSVFVMISYRLRTCNGVTSIIIEDYIVIDNRNYLISIGFFINPTCTIPNPMSVVDLKQAVTDAITQLLT